MTCGPEIVFIPPGARIVTTDAALTLTTRAGDFVFPVIIDGSLDTANISIEPGPVVGNYLVTIDWDAAPVQSQQENNSGD